jgi:hypothetical protein
MSRKQGRIGSITDFWWGNILENNHLEDEKEMV